MSTARFLVSVTSTLDPSNRIEKVLKRADGDRAIIYARRWIRDVQRVAFYCGTRLDQYEVYGLDDEGNWRPIEIGVLPDAEVGWPRKGAAPSEKGAPKSAATDKRTKSTRGARAKQSKGRTSTRTETAFGYGVTSISRTPRNSLQQRIEQMKRDAKQRQAGGKN